MRRGSVTLAILGAGLVAGCGGSSEPDGITPEEATATLERKSDVVEAHCVKLPGGGPREFRCDGKSKGKPLQLDISIGEDQEAITSSACRARKTPSGTPCEYFPTP